MERSSFHPIIHLWNRVTEGVRWKGSHVITFTSLFSNPFTSPSLSLLHSEASWRARRMDISFSFVCWVTFTVPCPLFTIISEVRRDGGWVKELGRWWHPLSISLLYLMLISEEMVCHHMPGIPLVFTACYLHSFVWEWGIKDFRCCQRLSLISSSHTHPFLL